MAKHDLPFEILDLHEDDRGLVIAARTHLSGMETIAVYPGASRADIESGKIFCGWKKFATFPNSKEGRLLAMEVLAIWTEMDESGATINEVVFNGGMDSC